MDQHAARIEAAIAEAARFVHAPATVEETLGAVARSALETVPGFDHVGISITHHDGRIETRAGTDDLVWELDTVQYELGEGPCYDSIRAGGVTVVENARHDRRWPRYMAQAAKRGLRAQLAIGLYRDEETLGGLNLYSTETETVDDDAIQIAELFAAHAAIALGRLRQETQLNEAISSRTVIGQATGILMERYRVDEHASFRFMLRASQDENVKLRAVAEELVRTANATYTRR